MDRITRSFRIVQQSFGVLMRDKELMVLPLLSGLIVAAVSLSFFFSISFDVADAARNDRFLLFVPALLIYFFAYAVGIFFQAAVVAGATERLRGGDPTIRSAMAAAARRIGPILGWALIAATVGVILRAARDRSGALGRIVTGLLGAAWSLGTFFVVPVLVLEDLSVGRSLARSIEVFKKTWGETVVGTAGVGIVAFLASVALVAVAAGLAALGAPAAALAFAVIGAIVLMVFFAALQGVYVASLYTYATSGRAADGFDEDLPGNAFTPKH
jgi:hypothetical protein